MLEMIKKYSEEIMEESIGNITKPEKQTVVLTIESVWEFLRNEYEEDILESYNFYDEHDEDDEDFEEEVEKLWKRMDLGDLQEKVSNYTFMDIYFVEMDGVEYAIGDIDYLEYDTILEYAEWYNEGYYYGDDEDEDEVA